MMKNRVVLLTSYFPYSETREGFLSPELNAIDVDKWDITIIATEQAVKTEAKREYPSNMKIGFIGKQGFSFFHKVYLLCYILSQKEFYKEVKALKKAKKYTFQNLKKLLLFCAKAFDIYLSLILLLKKNGYVSKNDNRKLLLYSYWMNASAYAIAMLKQKYGLPAICRVHGADLYEDRNDGYLPMRTYILEQLDNIFPASNAGCSYLINKYGFERKIKCWHLGSQNSSGQRMILDRRCFCIVTCAYIIPLKRIDAIAEAICGIEDIDIQWVHFGSGSDLMGIEKIIKSAKPNIECRLMGNVNSSELMEFYMENDVHLFINFSTTEGGVPQSIKEAMSFGIPVIATNVGGNPEIVKDHINGLLLDVDSNVEQLRECIIRFIRMPNDEYLKYREEAYKEWNMGFNIWKIIPEFYEDLNRLLVER